MPDFSTWNSERLCSYHEKLIERLIEHPDRSEEIEKRRLEILVELENRASNLEFVRPAQGLLSFYGYRVGTTDGRTESFRRQTLAKIYFEKKLPLIGSLAYVEEWGEPKSTQRLQKMKNCLVGFLNGNYPGYLNMETAFKQWQSDLEWLSIDGWPNHSLE